MEKNYHLKVNEHSLFFKSLDGVKSWFIKCGVKKRLVGYKKYVDLDNLESIVGNEKIEIYFENEDMCEMGEEYGSIGLYEIVFED